MKRCCQSNANLSLVRESIWGAGEGWLQPISFKRHRYPADVIRHAVWLYLRFTLSLRDVEELLWQRGIDVSYEAIRCWTAKFGPQFVANLKKARHPPSRHVWHLDEMVCEIRGERM